MNRRLLPALLGLCCLGFGCVMAKKIPSDATPVFNAYTTAVRNLDLDSIDRLLCPTLNHQGILNAYRTLLDSDRIAVADALVSAAPTDASTDIQIEIMAHPDTSHGKGNSRLVLTKSGDTWCVDE